MALNWFFSYFHNRTQCRLNNVKSALLNIKYGISQGSIVGPVLFVLYINDFVNSSSNLNLTLTFTAVPYNTNNLCETIPFINTKLLKISRWLYDNHITLHVAKTKYMIFYKKSTSVPLNFHYVTIATSQLEKTFEPQSLGMFLDLAWNFI